MQRIELGGRDVTNNLALQLRKAGSLFHTSSECEVVREVKEEACYVAADPVAEEASVREGKLAAMDFKLPDGQRVTLGAERFRAPELLFRPSLLGYEFPGVAEAVHMAVQRSDMELRGPLLQSLVLAGGTTQMRGFGGRLLSELRAVTPAETGIKIWAPRDRHLLAWVGGSILASLGTFKSLWVTRQQWEEQGASALTRAAL
jgi:centractin